MTIVHTDTMAAPTSWERAKGLYEKNIELETKRRKAAQARVPSDPGAWQQIRDNFEAIILEDHGFSEQHNIEFSLWQLHYRRIEELRAHFNAALTAAGKNAAQAGKNPSGSDRVVKIRMQFKTFLSEATGFYHDLILKIRAKYGLPLGCFSEDSVDMVSVENEGKKYANVKKGLISCHRCLIYLGDLARYKGIYGEGNSKARDHAAASSYYLQAASIWPSSGNPHHQLAILANYSGDELVAIYRYFRSLAAENPFITARENLVIAFEKNRQSYTQLLGDMKVSTAKELSTKLTRKGRGKGEAKSTPNDVNSETAVVNARTTSMHEIHKSFCIRFVRLNGILFTRTSLETFAEVLSSVSNVFLELLSSGPEEEMNFGPDAVENSLFIVRLVSVLIFTLHNVKESEGQTYAEIVQRAVLLQNACIAIFEFVGHILGRSVQLQDLSSSYLLPGIMIFIEWLACCPDIASGNDADEKQATVRMNFWRHCLSFFNKILLSSSIPFDDKEDETCFNNMTHYEDGETENCRALWEDFELRGFSPLIPAQSILDFSRKKAPSNDGTKEKSARIRRILAAGKALINVVRVDGKIFCFDSKSKKFIISHEPPTSEDAVFALGSDMPKGDMTQEIQPKIDSDLGFEPKPQAYVDGEEDDEVIVFKPAVNEKISDLPSHEGLITNQNALLANPQFVGGSVSVPFDLWKQATLNSTSQIPISTSAVLPEKQHPVNPPASRWLMEEATHVANRLKNVRFVENGHISEQELQKKLAEVSKCIAPVPVQQSSSMRNGTKAPDVVAPMVNMPAFSGVIDEGMNGKLSAAVHDGWRKSPVSRPVRHLGPPPGFKPVPNKQEGEAVPNANFVSVSPLTDDYTWLDGYQLPSSTNGLVLNNSVNLTPSSTPQYFSSSNGISASVNFPFPGKQAPPVQLQAEMQKGLQNYQAFEHLRAQQGQQLQQPQLMNGNQQFTAMHDQYPGQSIWGGRYIV